MCIIYIIEKPTRGNMPQKVRLEMKKEKTQEQKAKHAAEMRMWREKKESLENKVADDAHSAWAIGAKRVKAKGGYVTTDPAEISAMKDIYKLMVWNNVIEGKRKWCVDHIEEISLGGSHTLNNIRLCEFGENIKKSHRLNPRKKKTKNLPPPDMTIR